MINERGPRLVPASILLPVRTAITSGELVALTGWSHSLLHRYRHLYDFPSTRTIDRRVAMASTEIAEWFGRYGCKIGWL